MDADGWMRSIISVAYYQSVVIIHMCCNERDRLEEINLATNGHFIKHHGGVKFDDDSALPLLIQLIGFCSSFSTNDHEQFVKVNRRLSKGSKKRLGGK